MAGKKRKARRTERALPRVVAIVGSQSVLGVGLAERLASDPSIERVVAIDLRPPRQVPQRMIFRRVDLTRPSADQELADVLEVEGVDTVVHLAFFASPIHNATYAHELEAIGTLHVLTAAAAAQVERVVVQSTTTVYGAHPKNPNLLTEDHAVRGSPHSRFVNDKVEAERQAMRWAREHEEVAVSVLRFAPVVGPTAKNLFERYLTRPVAPTVAGYDPLIQALHESDALDALELAVRKGPRGVFNVAPHGVMPLSTALRLCGAQPLPLPGPLAAAALQGLRASGVTPTPASMLDYLRYVWVADGTRYERELGFTPRYSTREAIVALAERARRVA
ncbi:NAD-dependent epimerase/dehydratase family protein [Vulgatibacter sp.]|uniref:NAD-dependent epimerase/dehydratase family protein n=1 Tax=Vulgatibacter sp. TaxID=1971226 RepID=UPI0035663828